jgi:hypothetical protein
VSALSYDWEILQLESDRHFLKTGQRPKVAVVKGGGPVVEKKMTWMTSLLNLGGVDLDVVNAENVGEFTKWSKLAILVSSGDEMEQTLSLSLKAKGVEKIWSLGHPKKDTVVDRYVDMNINALQFIKDVHHIILEDV